MKVPIGTALTRYDDEEEVVVSTRGDTSLAVGSRWADLPFAHAPSINLPIVVGGTPWGTAIVMTPGEQDLPQGAEERLSDFLELAATVISAALERQRLGRLADQQGALVRLAGLTAQGVEGQALYDAIALEVGQLLRADAATLTRFEPDGSVTVLGTWTAADGITARIPDRREPEPGAMTSQIQATGTSVRIDGWDAVEGEKARIAGARHSVGNPITLGGQRWGALAVHFTGTEPPSPDTEAWLDPFARVVATAIANAEAQAGLRRLADRQAALRRVATLVAHEASSEEVFASVLEEAQAALDVSDARLYRFEPDGTGTVVGSSGVLSQHAPVGTNRPIGGYSTTAMVRDTGRPARIDDFENASGPFAKLVAAAGVRTAVACPVTVDGRLWGAILVSSVHADPLPIDTESRLSEFTELVATAISNADARAALGELVQQEATLRRLAVRGARGAQRQEMFDATVAEASQLLGAPVMALVEFSPGEVATIVGLNGTIDGYGPSTRLDTDGGALQRVLQSRRVERVDYARLSGALADSASALGITSAVAAPIHVDGRLWGSLVAATRDEPLRPSFDLRLGRFAELLGPAIGAAMARAELVDLLDEQAALRRVAELVARGAGQQEIFQAVADEASGLVSGEGTTLLRMSRDGTRSTILAVCGNAAVAPGVVQVIPPDDVGIVATIVRTRAPSRVDDYSTLNGTSYARDLAGIASAAGVPIILEGHVWGVIAASRWDGPLPPNVEHRLAQFAGLVTAALANSAARAEVQALADEHAALRRVAELVARTAKPDDVFDTVAREAATLLGEPVTLVRIDDGGVLVPMAFAGATGHESALTAAQLTALADQVTRTGRGARAEHAAATGESVSAAAAPIAISGGIWGLLVASSSEHAFGAGSEERITQFAELIAVSIANAEGRAALSASRARVIASADEARRRLQRDIHDGAQQGLVQTVRTLRLADEALRAGEDSAGRLVADALEQAQRAATDLRSIARGLLPAALRHGGLRAAVRALVTDMRLDVDVQITPRRFGIDIETTAYFIAAEALTNVVKHAHADRVSVAIRVEDEQLVVEVGDDGIGGVDGALGSGITGLYDRVEAADGTLSVVSPTGAGTTIRATLPLAHTSE